MAATLKRVFEHNGRRLYLRNPEEEPEDELEETPPKKRRGSGSAKKKKPTQIIISIVDPLEDCEHALRLLESIYKSKLDANADWDWSVDDQWLGDVENIFTNRLYEIGKQRLKELSHKTPGSKPGENGFVEAAIQYEGDEKFDPKRLLSPSNQPRVKARKEKEGAASHACTYSPPSSFHVLTVRPRLLSLSHSLIPLIVSKHSLNLALNFLIIFSQPPRTYLNRVKSSPEVGVGVGAQDAQARWCRCCPTRSCICCWQTRSCICCLRER